MKSKGLLEFYIALTNALSYILCLKMEKVKKNKKGSHFVKSKKENNYDLLYRPTPIQELQKFIPSFSLNISVGV